MTSLINFVANSKTFTEFIIIELQFDCILVCNINTIIFKNLLYKEEPNYNFKCNNPIYFTFPISSNNMEEIVARP